MVPPPDLCPACAVPVFRETAEKGKQTEIPSPVLLRCRRADFAMRLLGSRQQLEPFLVLTMVAKTHTLNDNASELRTACSFFAKGMDAVVMTGIDENLRGGGGVLDVMF